jgi:hypothetical protein
MVSQAGYGLLFYGLNGQRNVQAANAEVKAQQKQKSHLAVAFCFADRCPANLAEWTGLEPATPGVTGRYSNQLNYHSW